MNYYEILEVSQNASQEVIKAAYKSLMQRYHPDRNPGNAEVAKHAALVVQAYEELSDSTKRAAYDIKLKQQLTGHLNNIRDKDRVVLAPPLDVKGEDSYWFLWLLIAIIFLSGWLILSSSKKKQSPDFELKEIRLLLKGDHLTQKQTQDKLKRMDEIFREHPELLKKGESENAEEGVARTIPIFIAELTVNLSVTDKSPETSGKLQGNSGKSSEATGKSQGDSGKSPETTEISLDDPDKSLGTYEKLPVDSGHVLYIPILGVVVGTFDSERVIRHIENNKELISQRLAEKLADAKYEELIKIDGEHYLKEIILDSIGDTTGTDRHKEHPSSNAGATGRYGVVEVLLPESFSVH